MLLGFLTRGGCPFVFHAWGILAASPFSKDQGASTISLESYIGFYTGEVITATCLSSPFPTCFCFRLKLNGERVDLLRENEEGKGDRETFC